MVQISVMAYRGYLLTDASEEEQVDGAWYPIGPGRIGCVVSDTKRHLFVSEEALALLATIRNGYDAIGDWSWFRCDDGTHAAGWIGPIRRLIHPGSAVAARGTRVFREEVNIVPNEVPAEAATLIDDLLSQFHRDTQGAE